MATGLSSLITDAFTIYSEAYVKIGEWGGRVVDLDKKPGQPRLWKELVYATRLLRVIEPSLVLNGGGTAIIGVVGEISLINNLLLKLKRATKLFDLPAFPTPLTDIVINLGSGGGADADATYVTISTEGNLPQSRRIAAGTGISLSDGGAQGPVTVINTNAIDAVQVNTAINPVLNVNSQLERFFYGSDAITGTRTWSLSNSGNAKRISGQFSISGLTPGASTHDQTWPAAFTMSDARWISGSKIWRPIDDGAYEFVAQTFDGVTWKLQISEVYT